MTFFPNCTTYSGGSLPHTDPVAATRLILEYCPKVPAWPQLPNLSFKETMYIQFGYDMPGIVIDEQKKQVFAEIDDMDSSDLETFLKMVAEDNLDHFSYEKEYFAGFYEMMKQAKEAPGIRILKGQLTGPLSLGLKLTDKKRQSIIYNETQAEILVKYLNMKAKWQQKRMAEVVPETLIVFDEPYMNMFGSAFLSMGEDDVLDLMRPAMQGVEGMVGIHCCGNTDWGLIVETGVDVISLDAFNAGDVLSLYSNKMREFLDRGGLLAWGIVPSIPDDFTTETREDLLDRLQKAMGLLIKQGIELDTLLRQSFVSPSCGLGGMQEEMAEEALSVSKWISDTLRERHGLVD
jgi:methionine synthase II (cobalamin-independent)